MKLPCLLLLLSVAGWANTSLDGAWNLASSAEIKDTGETISKLAYNARAWYKATVPTTVMAALVADKVLSDPDIGMNLRETPGLTYPSGYNFSAIEMPPGSPFKSSWWYRRTFTLHPNARRYWLHLDGINFRANLWLNGRKLADSKQVAGMWRTFDFDVTTYLNQASENAIAIEVFPPTPHDLANTYADWNPMPPDKNMGIWRSIYLTDSGPVRIQFPQVISKVSHSLDQAVLNITAELQTEAQSATGQLMGEIGDHHFSETFTLGPNQHKLIEFKPLEIDHPKLWWPANMGDQNLHILKLDVATSAGTSDTSETTFGIREVTSELIAQDPSITGNDIPKQNLLFKINGHNILIRGGGYTFDMLLRANPDRQEAELDYVRDMHLNAIRLEGKIEDDHFLRLADQKGILIMAGWSCCDHWEEWKQWDAEDHDFAAASLRDQIHRLRNHPSLLAWLNGSDNHPPPDQEEAFVKILKQLKWPNPYISSATSAASKYSGESGVKMLGPYDYVSPTYWLTAHSLGGAYGFNTETGPGAAIPPIESLKKFLPPDHLWPIDSVWSYHAGGGSFRTLDVFNQAMDARYGPAKNLDDYTAKAQLIAYEGERAMFEAFGKNKYVATGVIQWMLNNAWPSIIWHLYDYYLRPGGGYFGAKKGCEPLHIQYSYDDSSIVVVNGYLRDFPRLTATAQVFNLNVAPQFSKSITFDSKADAVDNLFTIPSLPGLSETYFLRLQLTNSEGEVVSNNFYWLPRQPDVLDFARSTGNLTPTKTFGSLQSLQALPGTTIESKLDIITSKPDTTAIVTLKNTGQSVAFALDLRLIGDKGEILPVLWEDNYISLMPGEARKFQARIHTKDRDHRELTVRIKGWNLRQEP